MARGWKTAAVVAAGFLSLGGGAWADFPTRSCNFIDFGLKPFDVEGDWSGLSERERKSARAYIERISKSGGSIQPRLYLRPAETLLDKEGLWVLIVPKPDCPEGCIGSIITHPSESKTEIIPFFYRHTRGYDPESFPGAQPMPKGYSATRRFVLLSEDRRSLLYPQTVWSVPPGKKILRHEDAPLIHAVSSSVLIFNIKNNPSDSRSRFFKACLNGSFSDPEGFGFLTRVMQLRDQLRATP